MKIKNIIFLIIALCLCSCSNSLKEESVQIISTTKYLEDALVANEPIWKKEKSVQYKNHAVLIGNKIDLLNDDLDFIEDISNLSGQIVEILEISDSLFNNSDKFCDAFWYVKIKKENKMGIVNGRQVFQIQNTNQNNFFSIDGNKIEILTTEFHGMGVVYQGDLAGCPVDQPILIKDELNNYFGLVEVVPNAFSKKATWNDNIFSYFQLQSNDGAYDQIDSIAPTSLGIKLQIHRSFQEGENDYDVILTFDKNKYYAKYLNYGEIRY